MKRLLQPIFLLVCLLFSSNLVIGQYSVVKGKVVDDKTREPLPYVNIGLKGQAGGTFSDSNGAYRIELQKGEYTFIISSVGYEKVETHLHVDGKKTYTHDLRLTPVSQELSTVVVSASKYAQKIQESISSIEVLKARNIQISNLPAVDKAIDRMPGITIVNNEPQIRAGSGFSSGLGSRVMIMVDEMPLLRGDAGRPDWALLPIDDLEQIELVKGAASVVYGSSAINGAVNIRTSWPKAEPVTRVTSFISSYSKPSRKYTTPWSGMNPLVYGLSVNHSQRFDNIDFSGGVTYYNDQGYIGGTPEGKVSDTLYNGGQLNKRLKMYFNSRVRSKKVAGLSYGLNGNFMWQDYAEAYFWYDADTNIYRAYPGSLSKFDIFTFYLDPFVKYFAPNGDVHSFKNRFYYLDSDGLYNQTAFNLNAYNEYQYTHKFVKAGDLMLVAGVMNNFAYSYGQVFSGKLADDGTTTAGETGTYNAENFAVYAQLERKFFSRLSVLFGARYEFYNVADYRESKPIFRAGVNLQASKTTFLRAAVGQGYRVPSIGERYITTTSGNFGFYPNPELISELSVSYEVGIKQMFKAGKFNGMIDFAAFYEDYDNYIEFNFGYWGMNMTDPMKNVGFKFFNTGPARIYGIDLSAMGEGMVTNNLNISAMLGYTYSIPQSLDPDYAFYTSPYAPHNKLTYLSTSSDTTDYILKYRIQSILKADVQLTWKKWSGGFAGRYYGFMQNIDKFFYEILDGENFGVQTGIKKYREEHDNGNFIVDFRVAYSIRHFNFSVIINNLLNTEYSLRPVTIEAPRLTQFQVIYTI